MSINELRVAVTVFSLVLFVCIWVWAWSRRNQAAFQSAALLPLMDELVLVTAQEEQVR